MQRFQGELPLGRAGLIVQVARHIIEVCGFRRRADLTAWRYSVLRRSGRWLALLLAVVYTAGLPLQSLAQQPEFIDREPEIKAAYLYNFGRYVEWPGDAPKEFVIGVVGDNPVVAQLGKIAGSKKINGRTIVVRRFKSEKDFQQCQLLFVPAGQDAKLSAALVKKSHESATLIVGEDADFALKQGHIGFYADQNSVKFEINSGSAEKAGLKISSKLLSLGRIVGQKPGK
jgi:hypothetical protein